MKSIVNNTSDIQSKSFPKLMASSAHIVLFKSKRDGVVVARLKNASYYIGDHRDDWIEDSFKDFDGSVTLSND